MRTKKNKTPNHTYLLLQHIVFSSVQLIIRFNFARSSSSFTAKKLLVMFTWRLINFYIRINFPNKETRADVADGAANDAQRPTEQCHVAEVETRLEQTVHSAEQN